MHYAVLCEQKDIIQALLEAGADALAADNDGVQAIRAGDDSVYEWIRSLQSNISTTKRLEP